MKLIFLFITTVFAATDNELWMQFKEKYDRSYELQDEEQRFQVFQENLRTIEYHNARYEIGEESYFLKVTQFADLSPDEFKERLGHGIPTYPPSKTSTSLEVDLPYSVDWRDDEILSNIKNSGTDCMSSWAFSATAAMESHYALNQRAVLKLSEQNLIDCSGDFGNNGCQGGNVNMSFIYVQDHGIMFELEYPYEGQQGDCRFDRLRKSPVGIVGFATIDSGEIPLMIALYYTGPIATLMNGDSLQLYGGGVLDNKSCSSEVNYNVMAIGYGVDETSSKKYWLVRNSWGTDWGEEGYFKLFRSEELQCGLGYYNYYPYAVYQDKI